ncbi:PREDICTED: transcription factor DIVARICATA-like [Tarenaya hassleriana]|uniref:transcription factor DIVARICATA-like n=1 Tax=Tarenaya hassleriana TaxID=28532 RepID=UPI00053C81B3|nr:PREDICTED: transcription factor DIVARICATA-like [Tarenaya hassleriana]
METLHPLSHVSMSDRFAHEIMNRSGTWTKEENKKFERALAIYAEDTPDRWFRIAAMIPGKTVSDVMKQYNKLEEDVFDIEAGRVPIPGYPPSSFRFDHRDFDANRKRPIGGRGTEQERKKGVPWTEEEHRRFLLGLLKYGKGDWRNISRNFVVSKTPTQVASHAQKYYQRQLSGAKDKRRPSIHDITTVNLLNANSRNNQSRPLPDHRCGFLPQTHQNAEVFRDNEAENAAFLEQNLSSGLLFSPTSSPDDDDAAFLNGIKFFGQNTYSPGAYRNSLFL